MNINETQIYEKVAKKELTVDEALALIKEIVFEKSSMKSQVENVENMLSSMETEKFQESIDPASSTSQTAYMLNQFTQKIEAYILEKIKQLIDESGQVIHIEDNFIDLGLSSNDLIKLTPLIEEELGIELYPTIFFEYQSVKELAEFFSEEYEDNFRRRFGMDDSGAFDRSPVLDFQNKIENIEAQKFEDSQFDRESSPYHTGNTVISGEKRANDGNDIAIIGLSGRYPLANNLEEFWNNLKSGRNCITEIPPGRWDYRENYDPDKNKKEKVNSKWGGFIEDIDKFDPLFFKISPKEAKMLDPQIRLFLEIVWQTLEDAGYTRQGLEEKQVKLNQKVGLFVGSMYQQYPLLAMEEGEDLAGLLSNSSFWSIANRVSYFFNFQGPSIAIDTACSSSLTAIHMAYESIKRGECSMAIAGGVNITIHQGKYLGLSRFMMLESEGKSKSFGIGDGYVPGEGVGAVLLKSLSEAVKDRDNIYGVIKGSAINHGGRTGAYMVPNPNAQADLIVESLENAGVNPRTISYIESAANGSPLGDPIELAGLTRAFKKYTEEKQFCPIGSVKSNIGHLEAASGISQLTKALLQMKNKKLAPSINAEQINQNLTFKGSPVYLQKELEDWEKPRIDTGGEIREYPRRAVISSFGAGGSNAHLVVEEYNDLSEFNSQTDQLAPQIKKPYLFALSAKNDERLKEYAQKLSDFLNNDNAAAVIRDDISSNDADKDIANGSIALKDIAYTLQAGREGMNARLAIIAETKAELAQNLKNYLRNPDAISGQTKIFTGNLDSSGSNIREIISDSPGEDFINNIIKFRDYRKLALLWIEGAEIPWANLYLDESVRRISLPAYPFERKRYWINDGRKKTESKRNEKVVIRQDSEEKSVIITDRLLNIKKDLGIIVCDILDVTDEDLNYDDDLREYGFDSVRLIELLNLINKEYNLKIKPEVFFDHTSVSSFAKYLYNEHKGSFEKTNQDATIKETSVNISVISKPLFDIDVSKLTVRRAVTEDDIEKVLYVRWLGYRKYSTYKEISDVEDKCDRDANSVLLLATDEKNEPVGTMRILDRTNGKIELDMFVEVDKLLTESEYPCVELTRLSVPLRINSLSVKYALFKAVFNYCKDNKIPTVLISALPLVAKDYSSLLFEDVGDKGVYHHSALGGKEHRSYKLDITKAARLYKDADHPLYDFFFARNHPCITYKPDVILEEQTYPEHRNIDREVMEVNDGKGFAENTIEFFGKVDDEALAGIFKRKQGGIFDGGLLKNIIIRKARTDEDYEKILDIRLAVCGNTKSCKEEMKDESDAVPNADLLLAEDELGNAVGTMKILNRKHGEIELDKFVNVDSILSESGKSCAEASRLCVPDHPKASIIKLLFWKAFYLYSQVNQIKIWLISVSPDYVLYNKYFHFENAGPAGVYNHPGFGNSERQTLKLDVDNAEKIWEENKAPIYNFMCRDFQKNISMEGYMH